MSHSYPSMSPPKTSDFPLIFHKITVWNGTSTPKQRFLLVMSPIISLTFHKYSPQFPKNLITFQTFQKYPRVIYQKYPTILCQKYAIDLPTTSPGSRNHICYSRWLSADTWHSCNGSWDPTPCARCIRRGRGLKRWKDQVGS